jgi:membrane-bound metal-dependent hydrolase YbcI (DUF457 family)
VRLWGREQYLLYHRSFTHSVFGLVLLPLLLVPILRLFNRDLSFRTSYWTGFFGVLSHIVMDLFTGWGTMLLYPLTRQRFYLNWVFIIDPYVLSILFLPLVLTIFFSGVKERANRIALAGLLLYIGFCASNSGLAAKRMKDLAAERGYVPQRIYIHPQPFSPLLWMGVIEESTVFHTVIHRTVGSQAVDLEESFPKNLDRKEVQAALQTDEGRLFLSWAKLPVATVEELGKGYRVRIRDLRFRTRLRQTNRFSVTVDLDKNLKPIRAFWPWQTTAPSV